MLKNRKAKKMFRTRIKNIIPDADFDQLQDKEAKKEFNLLLKDAKKNVKNVNEKLLKKAFLVTLDANKDRIRLSGVPYYKYKISIARIVANEIKLDDVSIAATLLFGVLNDDNEYDFKLIQSEFGNTIAEIIQNLEKIGQIEEERIKSEGELENYRKLLLSLFKDVRIILIKLADRLENLRTINVLPEEKQQKEAHEALEVFAPFANRFGLRNIKWQIEDLSFKILHRNEYDKIKKKLLGTRKEREKYVNDFKKPIEKKLKSDKFLKKNNVTVEIFGRAKHIYSIYNKMIARNKSVEELYDLIAIRLIIEAEDPNICFYVYGIIASIYPPVPETFKDYINSPKQNGYQSIHTAVLGPRNKPVEVQIRTREMHRVAEIGVAAHFSYKRGFVPAKSVFENQNATEWMDSVRDMLENNETESPEQLFNFLKKNLFLKEIHVFTPTNELFTFPQNATPLDFAFEIHTDLGYHYIGAKVNGKIVPIDYKLQSGDQVTILTSENQTVKEEWLSIVRTSKAKSAINRFIKSKRSKLYTKGRKLWKKEIVNSDIGLKQYHIDLLVKQLGLEDEHQLYTELGKEKLDIEYTHTLIKEIAEEGEKAIKRKLKVREELGRDFITSLVISGKDRPGIVSEITKGVIKSGFATLYGVSFDTLDDEFEGKITMKLNNEKQLNKVVSKIKTVDGVNKVVQD